MLGSMPCKRKKGFLLTDSGVVTVLSGVCYLKLWPLWHLFGGNRIALSFLSQGGNALKHVKLLGFRYLIV